MNSNREVTVGNDRAPGIRVRSDGPLVVDSDVALFCLGRDMPGATDGEVGAVGVSDEPRLLDTGDRPDYVLCRCGRSDNKPFCDGSHRDADVDLDVCPAEDGADATGAVQLLVGDAHPGVVPGAGRGDRGLEALPSGVHVVDDGPLLVQGDIPVQLPSGSVMAGCPRRVLCRCGASACKPLCDGSHDPTATTDLA